MATVTFRLMQDDGITGPRVTLDVDESRIVEAGREWAASQTGHPWDTLTVEVDGGEPLATPQL